ncbi:MAG: HAD family hydrolase [Clostridia bacterium]|nr:HAD family hydrolase [Clostridia bacterium]
MIKLIVSDMDGTLLTPERNLPDGFFELMEKCRAKGAEFVVGSGRSWLMLRHLFEPYCDDMIFICDNGGFMKHRAHAPQVNAMKREDWLKSAADIDALGDAARAVLCGMKGVYVHSLPDEVKFATEITDYYSSYHEVENFADIDDEIFKTAICTRGASSEMLAPLEKTLPESLRVVLSGPHYLDVMEKSVSKGAALARLQKQLGVTADETMVFGDYYNDIEMLKLAKYSYIMENAVPDMRQHGAFTAPSNADAGVLKVMQSVVIEGKI